MSRIGKQEIQMFSNLDCYHFGSIESGLLAIEGKLVKGVKIEDADTFLLRVLFFGIKQLYAVL